MKKNTIIAGILGLVAAVLYFSSMANYAYPGESAHLMVLWQGLDVSSEVQYPLMRFFAQLLGAGNLIAPILGVLAVLLVNFLVAARIRSMMAGLGNREKASNLSMLGGAAAAIVFMLTPAVRSAATHLEPRLFDAVWAMAMFALLVPYRRAVHLVKLYPFALGAAMAFGFCDTPLYVFLAPAFLFAIFCIERQADRKPYVPLLLFIIGFLMLFFLSLGWFDLKLTPFLRQSAKALKAMLSAEGSVMVTIFATIPAVVAFFASRKSFITKPDLVQWIFHACLAVSAIIAYVTPCAPSVQMAPSGVLPVVACAYVAAVVGYLVAFLALNRKQPVSIVIASVFAFAVGFKAMWNLFTFDGDRGAFADEVAERIIEDLGQRQWFVTDGTLDDHLLLVADRKGRELHLIALQRDLDKDYLEALGKIVAEKGVGGAKNPELTLSLTLGVLPFVQDWFAADPCVGDEVAIYGTPDLWYVAGQKAAPELFFFGSDEKRSEAISDEAFTKEVEYYTSLLAAPKGWGSYMMGTAAGRHIDPVETMRLQIRRHLGLVANNRGVWLQDRGRADSAFATYELVLGTIDVDNVCSLFNEIEMAGQKHSKALDKKRELERRIKAIIDDKDRRYIIWRLNTFYGYIRNPDMFVRLGFTWARSGRPGDALAQIRRAIDFVPDEKRVALVNMMAALYANENDQRKSRGLYEQVLAKDANNHDALLGMMRLKLLDGDAKSALEYLERAVATSPAEGRRAQLEMAMVAMMKNDLAEATRLLDKVTTEDGKNLQAWSFLAAVTMQRIDAAKDNETREKLVKDIRERILPEMERQSSNQFDYYVQTTKAFLLMREGKDRRREARDAFEIAARANPGSAVAQDLVLGLDIQLDDQESAERHARDVLRRNRNAPLANYVMGSLAIRRAQYNEAEAFLRKAAEAPQPNVLALNDLAEVLRRTDRLEEAERYVRSAIEKAPEFYILRETLGVVLLDQNKNLEEAEESIRKALELSKGENAGIEDVRLYTSLARVQVARGDKKAARSSLRRVEPRVKELNDFERREYEETKKSAVAQ